MLLKIIFLGTSGWRYEEWVGPFYPARERMFSNYARLFNTTEINSTFYRYPSPTMIKGLTRAAPKGFIFAVKMPKVITHEKRLDLPQGTRDDLFRFLRLLEPMRDEGKLGPILIQLPPNFNFDNIDRLRIVELNGFIRVELNWIRGTKKAFWGYFLEKPEKIIITPDAVSKYAQKQKLLCPKYPRKFMATKMIELGINSDVVDFIQGHTPQKILTKHYADLLVAADQAYKIYAKWLKQNILSRIRDQ